MRAIWNSLIASALAISLIVACWPFSNMSRQALLMRSFPIGWTEQRAVLLSKN